MREILFRGQRVDTKEWVYGWYFESFTGISYIIVMHDHILGVTEMYEVIKETVGQFTYKIDKDEVRIFEGDLMRIGHYQNVHAIVWSEKGYWLCKPVVENSYHYTGRALWFMDTEFPYATVIGNIHTNPELLESE